MLVLKVCINPFKPLTTSEFVAIGGKSEAPTVTAWSKSRDYQDH